MDKPRDITLSEISQAEKDRYCMISLICGVQKSSTHRNRVERWYPGARTGGNGELLSKGTNFYKMNKFWASNGHGDDCS